MNNNQNQLTILIELAVFTLLGGAVSSVVGYLSNSPAITLGGIGLSAALGLASGMTSLQAYLKGLLAASLRQPQQQPTPINLQVNTPQPGNETTNISQGQGQGTPLTIPAGEREHTL